MVRKTPNPVAAVGGYLDYLISEYAGRRQQIAHIETQRYPRLIVSQHRNVVILAPVISEVEQRSDVVRRVQRPERDSVFDIIVANDYSPAVVRMTGCKVGAVIRQVFNPAGMHRSLDGARIGIRTLLTQIDVVRPIRENLEEEIAHLAKGLPTYIFSLPGINPVRAVSLFGETDPITTFERPDQLVAFAGLDVSVFQTGQYEASYRHMSKRGSPFLRETLWNMAFQAIYQEGEIRGYWLRKMADGLKHKAAVTATSIKLCHVTWRILTDKRDYLPEGRPN